jgi:DNA polymerase
MLVGLGPGESEDRFGRPFVGDAGEALNDMLSDAGIRREDIYLTNAVKCWTPGNNPSPHHIIVCSELYLREEIKTVHPQVIVALGNVAARAVVGSILYDGVINHYAGKNRPVMGMNNTWTFITYHPSAWLRSGQRDDLWNLIVGDLKVAYEAAWALEDKYAEQV